jgi:hypothetical protein
LSKSAALCGEKPPPHFEAHAWRWLNVLSIDLAGKITVLCCAAAALGIQGIKCISATFRAEVQSDVRTLWISYKFLFVIEKYMPAALLGALHQDNQSLCGLAHKIQ